MGAYDAIGSKDFSAQCARQRRGSPATLSATGERGALVRAFVAKQLGERHAYAWAIHEPAGHNPHVHIMFSERVRDGIERGPEQYFKRANSQAPRARGDP